MEQQVLSYWLLIIDYYYWLLIKWLTCYRISLGAFVIGSNSATSSVNFGQTTKKVWRRPDEPPDIDDPMVDGNGLQMKEPMMPRTSFIRTRFWVLHYIILVFHKMMILSSMRGISQRLMLMEYILLVFQIRFTNLLRSVWCGYCQHQTFGPTHNF